MSSQKEARRAMLGAGLVSTVPSKPPGEQAAAPPPALPERVVAGAVGAVSRSLGQFQSDLRSVQNLVATGERILELDPAQIDPASIRDRIDGDDDEQQALVAAIRENGQQVPILVRPAAKGSLRYQVAYGHRRLAACQTLRLKVKAIVRELSDRDLVVAQGQENSARKDLSFIERASFALKLERAGHDRETIMAALSTDKTELSKLIAVARAVPNALIEAIGPAPKAGRPRWLTLVAMLQSTGAERKAIATSKEPSFAEVGSDERFLRVFAALQARAPRDEAPEIIEGGDGRPLIRVERSRRGVTLQVDPQAAGFDAFLIARISALYDEFRAMQTAAE